jgi:hypothetical protein
MEWRYVERKAASQKVNKCAPSTVFVPIIKKLTLAG